MQNDFDKGQYLMIINSNKENKKWQSMDLFLSFPFGLGYCVLVIGYSSLYFKYWQICQSSVVDMKRGNRDGCLLRLPDGMNLRIVKGCALFIY